MKKSAIAVLLLLPAWMTGTWRATSSDGSISEEIWSPADGTLMTGMHRDVAAGKETQFEFLRIEQRGDDLIYLAMPGGAPPTEFKATKTSGSKITFENPQHDFPKRIHYWKDGEKLCAAVDGGSDESAQRWCWNRVP